MPQCHIIFGSAEYRLHAQQCGRHGGMKHAKTLICASSYDTAYICPFSHTPGGSRPLCPYQSHIPKGQELDELDASAALAPAMALSQPSGLATPPPATHPPS